MKPSRIPSIMYGINISIPSNPQELKPVQLVIKHARASVNCIDVLNTKNLTIPEWVIQGRIIRIRIHKHHNVMM
jgi:hypothetical protein